jgi:anti-anti-sigma factor
MEVKSMTWRQGNGFVVLRPEGDLCEGPESDRVEAALAAWAGQRRRVIVDLSRTRQLSARGLGILARAHQESTAHGGRIGVCGATALHLWLLRVTCVAKFLTVYKTKAAAVAALSGVRAVS